MWSHVAIRIKITLRTHYSPCSVVRVTVCRANAWNKYVYTDNVTIRITPIRAQHNPYNFTQSV